MIIVKDPRSNEWFYAKNDGLTNTAHIGNLKCQLMDLDTSYLCGAYVINSKRNQGVCQKLNEAVILDIQESVNEKREKHYLISKTRKDNNIINHIMLKLKFKMMVFDENIIWGKVIEPE
jgi:hypothetical protein